MLSIRSISQPEELWEIFEEELKDHLSALTQITEKNVFSTEDNKKLSHRLHRLKGSLGFIGFEKFFIEVTELENLLKSQDNNFNIKTKNVLKGLKLLLDDITDTLHPC
jgi:HPt (histidine-containing phosphotransfer) domain-containing protein